MDVSELIEPSTASDSNTRKTIDSHDLWSMYLSAVILILVLIVAYMGLQLFRLKDLDGGSAALGGSAQKSGTERFWANRPYYFPDGPPTRNSKGLTTGQMPSMEVDYLWGSESELRTCCGSIGVPP